MGGLPMPTSCTELRLSTTILATKTASMPPPKFLSRFSKKVKHRLAGDGRKSGGSRTDVDRLSVDLGKKGDDYEGEVALMGLPLLTGNSKVASDGGRTPELGRSRIDVNKWEAGSTDSSPQLGGGEVPGIGRRRGGSETIVEGKVGPVNPPLQSHLGISQGDLGRSGST